MFKRFIFILFIVILSLIPMFASPKTAYACSDSWSLSAWSTTGCGTWAQQPVLMDTCSYYYYSTPQEYISKLQDMQSMGYTGGCPSTIGQCINQFQNVVPEFQATVNINFSANPNSINLGQSSTLSWSSWSSWSGDPVYSCSASGYWSGNKSISGSQTVSPTSTATYNLSCRNYCRSASKSTTVTVVNQPPIARFKMTSGSSSANENGTLNLSGAPASVLFNASTSSDPDGSISSYVWKIDDAQVSLKQNFTYDNLTAGTHQISLTVTDNSGATGSATATIIVTKAIISDPDCKDAYACFIGQSPLNLKWAVDDASSCTIENGIYSKPISSTGTIEDDLPKGKYFYKLKCANATGGEAERTIRITIK